MLADSSGRIVAKARAFEEDMLVADVISEGLTTAVHPAARANGSFCDTMRNGKFHGVIIPKMPAGRRIDRPIFCGSPEGAV